MGCHKIKEEANKMNGFLSKIKQEFRLVGSKVSTDITKHDVMDIIQDIVSAIVLVLALTTIIYVIVVKILKI